MCFSSIRLCKNRVRLSNSTTSGRTKIATSTSTSQLSVAASAGAQRSRCKRSVLCCVTVISISDDIFGFRVYAAAAAFHIDRALWGLQRHCYCWVTQQTWNRLSYFPWNSSFWASPLHYSQPTVLRLHQHRCSHWPLSFKKCLPVMFAHRYTVT